LVATAATDSTDTSFELAVTARIGRGSVAALAALILIGCTSGRREPDAALTSCENVAGLAPLLVPSAIIVLGEIHGTVEAPALVARAACQASAAGLPVTVGLEIWQTETDRVATFLDGSGSEAERSALLAGRFWRSSYQDGRRSAAMATLLERLRRLRQSGREIDVALLDREGLPATERERHLASSFVAAASSRGDGLLLILAGDRHVRLSRGSLPGGSAQSMTEQAHRSLAGRSLTSLEVAHSGGTAWTCGGQGCGPHGVGGSVTSDDRGVTIYSRVRRGFHGRVSVGPVHASPPAVADDSDRLAVARAVAARRRSEPPGGGAVEVSAAPIPARSESHRQRQSPGSDWPGWLGPSGDTTVRPGLLVGEAAAQLAIDWRRPLGAGYSSITVSSGRLFTLEADSEAAWLLSLDAIDGRQRWRLKIRAAEHGRVEKPLSTPATDGLRVFALGAEGMLVAADADSGAIVWSRDLGELGDAVPRSRSAATSRRPAVPRFSGARADADPRS